MGEFIPYHQRGPRWVAKSNVEVVAHKPHSDQRTGPVFSGICEATHTLILSLSPLIATGA